MALFLTPGRQERSRIVLREHILSYCKGSSRIVSGVVKQPGAIAEDQTVGRLAEQITGWSYVSNSQVSPMRTGPRKFNFDTSGRPQEFYAVQRDLMGFVSLG